MADIYTMGATLIWDGISHVRDMITHQLTGTHHCRCHGRARKYWQSAFHQRNRQLHFLTATYANLSFICQLLPGKRSYAISRLGAVWTLQTGSKRKRHAFSHFFLTFGASWACTWNPYPVADKGKNISAAARWDTVSDGSFWPARYAAGLYLIFPLVTPLSFSVSMGGHAGFLFLALESEKITRKMLPFWTGLEWNKITALQTIGGTGYLNTEKPVVYLW